ncbi:sodium:proton antiporter [Clavibacter michiganensis]|uniref:Sodium:proton antiporter n=1 Tax=Clavibacter michiganensis TaxID=28447 RepID=A0A2S5VYG1_9MICO|nr:sodium:proton antiporter [Clavibacter michiganensis]PPF71334.1 sodium:proton antiporter [Clavibacter michiganensis]
MDYAALGVAGIAILVAVTLLARRIRVATPLVLVLVGVGISYLPGVPPVEVPPELILAGVLPPLLYGAAVTVPLVDLRRNLRTIVSLSVVLVLVSAFGIGLLLYALFPDLSFAGALALGAVVSPPDAVAATSIARRLGLPPRLVTVLEGEGLVNDATALVLLRTSIAAVGASVELWAAAGGFLLSAVGALAIGLAVGVVTTEVRRRLDDPVLDTAISFAVPFVAFIPAEEVGASGVLAVVAAGIWSGHRSASTLSASSRINERLNWRTVLFLLENGVFLLMGLELRDIVDEVHEADLGVGTAVAYGILTLVVLTLLRFGFLVPLLLGIRRHKAHVAARTRRVRRGLERLRSARGDERPSRRERAAARILRRRGADLRALRSQGLGWRGGLVLGWAGMRGVVTLAAAQSLPSETPYRAQLVLIAFTVAIGSLLVNGGTLPTVIRLSGIRGSDAVEDQRHLAELVAELTRAGMRAVDEGVRALPEGTVVDDETVERVRRDTAMKAERVAERADDMAADLDASLTPRAAYLLLRRKALDAEREALREARGAGEHPSRVLARAQRILDQEEARLGRRGDAG